MSGKMAPAATGAQSAGIPAQIPAESKGLKDTEAGHAALTQNTVSEKKEVKIEGDRLLKTGDVEAVQELVNLVKIEGPDALQSLGIEAIINKGLGDKKNATAREAACSLISSLCEQGVGHELEPFFFENILTSIVEAMGDKEKPVRESAQAALKNYVQVMSNWSVPQVLKVLLAQARTAGKWQVKQGCVATIEELVTAAPDRMAAAMPDIIPVMAEVIWDTKTDVQKASRACLKKLCNLISNKDIERFIPALINSLIHPVEEVPKTIQLLGATTFVSEVDSPTLALMAPLLSRGLSERATPIKRKVAVIIDNMSKLVDNERTVRPFLPKLLPGLIKMESTMADPEARGVVQRAIKTLRQIGQVEGDGSSVKPLDDVDVKVSIAKLNETLDAEGLKNAQPETKHYISVLVTNLANARNFEATEWDATLIPYLSLLKGAEADKCKKISNVMLQALAKSTGDEAEIFEDEEEGEDLCNCQFSLAYGAKILLNTATLRLKRGHRYGLCGRNGSGKSTLMRAIQNGQVEGFPSPDEVRTWYVEHDLDGSEGEISILDFIVADKRLNTNHEEAKSTLLEMGFDEGKQSGPIAALSGGWKMKLALARAVLFKADILLLDEPTNHLDVLNIKWIADYLNTQNATCIIVSHDSKFLNDVCTDILYLNRFKVKRYPGTLDAFVQRVPEAKSYIELSSGEDYSFKLPDPPLLDGVKTKEKSLAKMRNVWFQYPNTPDPQLKGVTMQLSLSSRVAVLGPNGSGKSTLVKLLVGDTEPKSGEVWKHPNLVIGYVAQHAFHHIDQHLDKTPLEYMLWRYQTGEDLEEMMKNSRKLTDEDKEKMKNGEVVVVEGVKRLIEDIVSRKKLKNSFQYEVSFKNYSSADNQWLSRDELINRGFEKKVMQLDAKVAQELGMNRPLVKKEIEQHFALLGLEAEFTSHSHMRGLSGGQKVKVVLAAATWRRPHVIILDEPTNFLDRESLAALIASLKDFQGGVAFITHSLELAESAATERWKMANGTLEASGANWVEGQGSGARIDKKEDDEEDVFDAMGNKVAKAGKKKALSSGDKRKAKKERMARRKRGEEVFTDEEEL